MNENRIIPFNGFNNAKLGFSKFEIQKSIGKPSRTINNTDYYQREHPFFSIHYNDKDLVEYIEISNPQSDKINVLLYNLDVFHTPSDILIEHIKKNFKIDYDHNDPEIPYSYIFREIEISLWRPCIPENETDDEGRFFETVGIGMKDYY